MFWLRWTGRDLRARWLLVLAIAATIAIGTGAYAGLESTTSWRRAANEASYLALNMYDLRVRLPSGVFVPAGSLRAVAGRIPDAGGVAIGQERLLVQTQVDASTASQTILVPGLLIGVDVTSSGVPINGVAVDAGRGLEPGDAGAMVGVLEYHFAHHYDLPPSGTLHLSGGVALDYVGQGVTPEFFVVTTTRGGLLAEANFAAIVVPIEAAARTSGHAGQVNDLLLKLRPGTDVASTQRQLTAAMAADLPGVAATVLTASDDETYQLLTRDAESDNQFFEIFALLMLAGATLAAFNLMTRIVEAQRREIGVSMALGTPVLQIAIRPLLLSAEVAAIGVLLGIGVGLIVGRAMDQLLQAHLLLPVWSTPFQPDIFARGAALGFVLPFAASFVPVWRATRVAPVTAIRTGVLTGRESGLSRLGNRLRLPGGSIGQMPLRNILRTPRRSIFTALGVAATIAVFVAGSGLVDTFLNTIDQGEQAVVQSAPDRLEIDLAQAGPAAAVTARLAALGVLDRIEPELRVAATAHGRSSELDLTIDLVDTAGGSWRPLLSAGSLPRADAQPPGIVLAQAAAAELHVAVGDEVILHHVRPGSATGLQAADDRVVVTGLQPMPLRLVAYMDRSADAMFGPSGTTNLVMARPAAGETVDSVRRVLFSQPDVVSAQAVGTLANVFRNVVDQYLGLLNVVRAIALVLAVLIAANSSTIALDERAREHATMFAFGARLRTVLGIAVAENALLGIAGSVAGIVAGRLVLEYLLRAVLPSVVPDIGFAITLGGATVASALLLGVAAIAATPLLGLRKLSRMDLPSALRIVE